LAWRQGEDQSGGSPYCITNIASELKPLIRKRGVEAAIVHYRAIKAEHAESFHMAENELNNLGYELLAKERIDDAAAIFALNVEMFPQAFNTYDSLAESYWKQGKTDLAVKNYRKSLELNPDNQNAQEMLRKIEAERDQGNP
jgi:tetratricopeptide (TPR) repeat protein